MVLLLLSVLSLALAVSFLLRMSVLYVSRDQIRPGTAGMADGSPLVSVIIPARNEEENIGRCLRSLALQTYPADRLEILVVDDHSEDGTAGIVRALAGEFPGIRLLSARPLVNGWTGKNNACASAAAEARGEWLCFVDADTCAEPDLLRAALTFAVHREADLLSFNPFQEMVSLSERIWLPGVFVAIAQGMDFRRANDPRDPEAIANGQFLLFRRSAYEALGGHAAVAGVVMEDMAFARLVKTSGKRLCWAFGDEVMRTRMYRSFPQIWRGFSKNMSDIANRRTVVGATASALRSLLLAWLPLLLTLASLLVGDRPALGINAVTLFSLGFFGFMVVRALRLPFAYVLGIPLGFSLYAALVLKSLWNVRRGTVEWKGRVVS